MAIKRVQAARLGRGPDRGRDRHLARQGRRHRSRSTRSSSRSRPPRPSSSCPSRSTGVVAALLVDEGDDGRRRHADHRRGRRRAGAGAGPGRLVPAADADRRPRRPGPTTRCRRLPRRTRQPVLVGYGVKTAAAKRRPRKPAARPRLRRAPHGRVAPLRATPSRSPAAPTAEPQPPVRRPEGGRSRTGQRPHGAAPRPRAGGATLAKPPVRKLAKDLGVDLAALTGTGPAGARSPATTSHAGRRRRRPAAHRPRRRRAAPRPAQRSRTRIPIKGVRKATAQAMVASRLHRAARHRVPHGRRDRDDGAGRAAQALPRLRRASGSRRCCWSPRRSAWPHAANPELNSSWDEAAQEIVVKHYVNLGIAAATPRGLIVPNIKDAHALPSRDLAGALGDLVATARAGKTQPAEMAGGTFTITNVGVFGVDAGTPILNPGESAILAFGQVRDMPWVVDGQIEPRKVTHAGAVLRPPARRRRAGLALPARRRRHAAGSRSACSPGADMPDDACSVRSLARRKPVRGRHVGRRSAPGATA